MAGFSRQILVGLLVLPAIAGANPPEAAAPAAVTSATPADAAVKPTTAGLSSAKNPTPAAPVETPAVADALDGKGPSKVGVDLKSYAGNLELHVHPHGALAGLRTEWAPPILTVHYWFKTLPQRKVVQRIELDSNVRIRDKVEIYRDPGVHEFDRVIVSGSGLSSDLEALAQYEDPARAAAAAKLAAATRRHGRAPAAIPPSAPTPAVAVQQAAVTVIPPAQTRVVIDPVRGDAHSIEVRPETPAHTDYRRATPW